MSEDPRGRVLRLVELAVAPSANETEARNAAMAACKLIKEHKLLEGGTPRSVPGFSRVRVPVSEDLASALEDLFGAHQRPPSVKRHARPAARPPPQHTVEGSEAKPVAPLFGILAGSAVCKRCLRPMKPGTPVAMSGPSVFHRDCWPSGPL
jgi:hypothetical protein